MIDSLALSVLKFQPLDYLYKHALDKHRSRRRLRRTTVCVTCIVCTVTGTSDISASHDQDPSETADFNVYRARCHWYLHNSCIQYCSVVIFGDKSHLRTTATCDDVTVLLGFILLRTRSDRHYYNHKETKNISLHSTLFCITTDCGIHFKLQ